MDTSGFNITQNETDCPKITKHDEQLLHSIQFWIGGVVSCCVAITGKNQILRFFFFLQKKYGENSKVWMVLAKMQVQSKTELDGSSRILLFFRYFCFPVHFLNILVKLVYYKSRRQGKKNQK